MANGSNPLSTVFSPLEMLIICDLVNDEDYMTALLEWRAGQGRTGPGPGGNRPSQSKDLDLPSAADTDDWHTAAEGAVKWWSDNKQNATAPQDIEQFAATIKSYPGTHPTWDEVEPPNAVILDFLIKLRDWGSPWPEKRQKLCLLSERFAGVLHVATGARIVRSLTMFVDFTVRKDNGQSKLAW